MHLSLPLTEKLKSKKEKGSFFEPKQQLPLLLDPGSISSPTQVQLNHTRFEMRQKDPPDRPHNSTMTEIGNKLSGDVYFTLS